MIYKLLMKYRTARILKELPEYKFYKENKAYLTSLPWLKPYHEVTHESDLLFSTILIRSLINKQTLERGYEIALKLAREKYTLAVKQKQFLEEKMATIREDLPSFEIDGHAIFIPFFDRATNLVYSEQIEKLEKYPYSLLKDQYKDLFVDPFETYHFSLFESSFSTLTYIGKDATSHAYYNANWDILLFINDQGTIDYQLPLFDRHLKSINRSNINERLKPVADAYFKFDKKEMVEALYKGGFISLKLYQLISRKEGLIK